MDLSLKIGTSFSVEENSLNLDLQIEPLYDLCHTHVIRDSKGIGVIDHRSLTTTLFEGITGKEDGKPLKVSISLTELGIIPSLKREPGTIEFDGKGNCFMNLAIESIDTSNFCFISSLWF